VPFSEVAIWLPDEMRIEMLDAFMEATPWNIRNRKAEAMVAEDYFVAMEKTA
jgi:hypothetical protein